MENLSDGPEGEYLTDRIGAEAAALIRSRDPQRPFFLNLWHYAVHTPLQAKAEDIAYFEEKAKRMGLDQQDPFEICLLYTSKVDYTEQKKLAAAVSRIATNINHVCRRINSTGHLYDADVAELKERMADVWELLKVQQRNEL